MGAQVMESGREVVGIEFLRGVSGPSWSMTLLEREDLNTEEKSGLYEDTRRRNYWGWALGKLVSRKKMTEKIIQAPLLSIT